jgi:hypothetical protein
MLKDLREERLDAIVARSAGDGLSGSSERGDGREDRSVHERLI